MRRLIFNQVPPDFSPDRDAVLSISSFIGRESLYPGWEDLDFVDVFKDIGEQMKGYTMIRDLACDHYLTQFARKLNNYHATNLSVEFWGILIKPWMLLFINMSWFLYLQLTKFIEQHPSEAFEVDILINKNPWDFEDTMDFLARGYRDIRFHHWLLSLFLQEINPKNWLMIPMYTNDSNGHSMPSGGETLASFEYLKHKISNFSYSRRCVDVYGLSRIQQLLFSLYLELKPIREKNERPPTAVLVSLEKKNYASYFPALYLKVIDNQIENVLPKMFCDGFDSHYLHAKKHKYVKNRLRLIGPVNWYNERAKFLFANAKEMGEKIVCTQHGGIYGIAKIPNIIPDIDYAHEYFFSWGWQQHGSFPVNAYALPSPFLSRLEKKRNSYRKTGKLIFVGVSLSPFELRFDILPKGKRLLLYRKEKRKFLQLLSPDIFAKTYYRTMPSNYPIYLEEKTYLRSFFSTLKFLEGMPAPHPEMIKCKLLVLDNPQTTLHISLASNIPTICYWNKNDWAIADGARPYFEALEQAGVILPDAETAALKVNQIWDHVEDWWKGRDIQEARAAWCHEYARSERFWWYSWIKTLWKI
ncbi:MAG: LIC12162 family protein [Deltaproteobacteria bacterium]|nr:LIC12162 family protein [Deltaproteobacteria bacterium]